MRIKRIKGEVMRILTITLILGLPLMALGQTAEPQQTQGQTSDTQTTAPATGKKMRPVQEKSESQAKPETGTDVRRQTDVKDRAPDMNSTQTGARSSTSQTNVSGTSRTTTVNKQEFRSRHSEVFSLRRHPKDFFVQRFGTTHFRLIGKKYFVFVDGCWVSVDVDGFTYIERVICAGEPEFIAVE